MYNFFCKLTRTTFDITSGILNPLIGKLCNSALKNLIFNTHDTLWIVNEKTTFLIWSCDLNFHTELLPYGYIARSWAEMA